VQAAFETKISGERILKEVDKMFEGRNPHVSVQQMHAFRILPIALKPPTEVPELSPENITVMIEESVRATNIMGSLFATIKHD